MLPNKLAFVDIETTGTRSFYDRIIEIGIIRVENNKITNTFQSLINPETGLPTEISKLTGIYPQDITNAPTFRKIKNDVLDNLKDCIFVAHNVRFDYSFIKNEFLRENISFSSKHLCTVRLSRALYPQFSRHNLDSIINRFNFSSNQRHRAYNDAEIIFRFYNKVLHDFHPEELDNIISKALKKPSLPIKLNTNLDKLSENAGVYIFYGEDGISQTAPAPLYIGKSINIRERVLSHFSSDIHSPLEMKMSQQITSIETIETAGELGALLLESELIKTMLPLYNKRSRLKKELIGLKTYINTHGYQEVKLETLRTIQPSDIDSYYGFFPSKKKAKDFLILIAKNHKLCEKLLGIEKTKNSCFSYKLGVCQGACIQKENAAQYNLRCITSLIVNKIKTWPFKGAIQIKETNGVNEEYFLINKWCYLGKIKTDQERNNNKKLLENPTFDLDIYKILKRYIFDPKNYKKIKPLTLEEIY